MTIASSSVGMTPPSRGVKKTKISLHKRENSTFKELELLHLNDGLLQSSSAHRRYMRRGSRTPMMFQIEAATTMISQNPQFYELNASTSDSRLQSSTSLRRYMRRGSRTPMMFQLDAAAVISHDPSFDDDTVSTRTSRPNIASSHQPRCSPIMAILTLQLEGTNEAFQEASELQSSLVENPSAESL
jgi:hypothetical protein